VLEIQLLAHARATVRNRSGYGSLGMVEWEVEPEQADAIRATLLSNPTIWFDVTRASSDTRSRSAPRWRRSPTWEWSCGRRCSSFPTRWSRSPPTRVAMGEWPSACRATMRSRCQPRFACRPYTLSRRASREAPLAATRGTSTTLRLGRRDQAKIKQTRKTAATSDSPTNTQTLVLSAIRALRTLPIEPQTVFASRRSPVRSRLAP
jgi:hypothetical protein